MFIKIISKIISKIKGEPFLIDENIPFSYLFFTLLKRIINLLRGTVVFYQLSKRVYVAPKTIVKAKSKFKLGQNTSIAYGCYIDALSKNGIVLGHNVSIGKFSTIECTGSLKSIGTGLKIGNNVGLGTHGFWGCAGGIEVGDDTIFGNYVSLHSENHNYSQLDIPIRMQGINRQGIKIGNNCWIGAKVTILDGAIIGNGVIIAAGALVTQGIYENDCIYGGIPVKLIKKRY